MKSGVETDLVIDELLAEHWERYRAAFRVELQLQHVETDWAARSKLATRFNNECILRGITQIDRRDHANRKYNASVAKHGFPRPGIDIYMAIRPQP